MLAVIYLTFSTAYREQAGAGLATKAIDLARLLRVLMPDESEVTALLALLLLHHARRMTRRTAVGEPIPLEEQDRSRWDADLIAEGAILVEEALRRGPAGRYQSTPPRRR